MRRSEDGARAGNVKARCIEWNRGRDLNWHWSIRCGAEGAAEVANVTTHEDEGRWCSAGKAGDVSNSMSRNVEKKERTVTEEIEGGVLADPVGGLEIYLMKCVTSVMGVSTRHFYEG